jgi:hypothetical protein
MDLQNTWQVSELSRISVFRYSPFVRVSTDNGSDGRAVEHTSQGLKMQFVLPVGFRTMDLCVGCT